MKVESVIINFLVAVVAILAGHIFWPAPAPVGGTPVQPPNAAIRPGTNLGPTPVTSTQASPFFGTDMRARLEKAHDEALAADPSLKAEESSLLKARENLMKQNPPASPQDREALMARWKEHTDKLRENMIKIDAALQPFYAKIDSQMRARQAPLTSVAATGSPASVRPLTNNTSAIEPTPGH